ncbi:MAG TPA: RluA family pseudouridine synthase [Chloroflexota bacterium]|nr:RluA family pseudouridine synthase [Chloroflexota bacterium]
MSNRIVVVDPGAEGSRVDRFLADHIPDFSRGRIQRLIQDSNVTINGSIVRASERLHVGQRVTVVLPPPESTGVVAADIPLDVVLERPDLVVLNKPAGIVVHPAPGHPADTVANALMARYPNLAVGNARRPGIVHRLDKDTSGLMVVALTDRIYLWLIDLMARRQVHKEYLALVHGDIGHELGSIEAPIGRDRHDRLKMGVVPEGRPSTTGFRVIERFPGFTLVRLHLETGRTHQIRVHLAAIGHPVAGDPVYGTGTARRGPDDLDRLFLHAWRLELAAPSDGHLIRATAPLPPELERVLVRLRSDSGGADRRPTVPVTES